MKLSWSNNTCRLGKVTIGRVEKRDKLWVVVLDLPQATTDHNEFESLEQCKLSLEYFVNIWLAQASILTAITTTITTTPVNLGVQSGTLVQKWGKINILTKEWKGDKCKITWVPYDV